MQRRKWQTLPDHPDVTAAREALLVQEGYHEAVRGVMEASPQQAELLAWMKESESVAVRLRQSLAARQLELANKELDFLRSRCQRCHDVYRR
jgi:hypothetical protein